MNSIICNGFIICNDLVLVSVSTEMQVFLLDYFWKKNKIILIVSVHLQFGETAAPLSHASLVCVCIRFTTQAAAFCFYLHFSEIWSRLRPLQNLQALQQPAQLSEVRLAPCQLCKKYKFTVEIG